jgi:hypothetical protein
MGYRYRSNLMENSESYSNQDRNVTSYSMPPVTVKSKAPS